MKGSDNGESSFGNIRSILLGQQLKWRKLLIVLIRGLSEDNRGFVPPEGRD
jgi:hypothetical protein